MSNTIITTNTGKEENIAQETWINVYEKMDNYEIWQQLFLATYQKIQDLFFINVLYRVLRKSKLHLDRNGWKLEFNTIIWNELIENVFKEKSNLVTAIEINSLCPIKGYM